MFYAEYSKYYSNQKGNCINIGWLHPKAEYNTGAVPMEFVDKLFALLKRESVNLMRGFIGCQLSPCMGRAAQVDSKGIEKISVDKVLLVSEIWVPNQDGTKIFVAPSMIIHYIQKHGYQPPLEFMNAVIDFDLNSEWSGKAARKACMIEVFGPH